MFRRSPRALALWLAAFVLASVTAVVVASDLAALHRRAHDLGPARVALVARHDLPLGTTLEDDDLRERRVHTSQLPSGVLDRRTSARGRVVQSPVLRGGFVTRRNVAPRDRHGLDGAIPEGMRAVRVVVTNSVRPRPGAAVDVLASFDGPTTGDSSSLAALVARGVLVVEVDQARTDRGDTGLGVTILVTPREARDVAVAATHGVVTLALVPPEEARAS